MDGGPASCVKGQTIELEIQKIELEAQPADGKDKTVLAHLKTATHYHEQLS